MIIHHIKKLYGKLNKKQAEEIGTLKSPTKPLSLTHKKIEELTIEKKELQKKIPLKYEIENQVKEFQNEIQEEEEILKILQEMELIHTESEIQESKIKIQERERIDLEKSKQKLDQELGEIKPVNEEKNISKILYIIPLLIIVASIIIYIYLSQIISAVGILIGIIMYIFILIKNAKINHRYQEERNESKKQKRNIKNKIELIEEEIKLKDKLIDEAKATLELKIKMQEQQIKMKYPSASKISIYNIEDKSNIIEEQNYINQLKLELNKKELEKGQIVQELERLVEIEERLNKYKEELKELEENDIIINIAKEAIQKAYLYMKNNVKPKFEEDLSRLIEHMTSGKYKKVRISEESGILIEIENRKLYYSCKFKSTVQLINCICL